MNSTQYAEIVKDGGKIKTIGDETRIFHSSFKKGSRKISLTTFEAIKRKLNFDRSYYQED